MTNSTARVSGLTCSAIHYACLVICLTAGLLIAPARADVESCRNFEIHHTTFNSLLISPAVAAAHNITRSKRRIITNITIIQNGKSVTANVAGTNTNLFNQLFTMQFDEIIEPGAIYYLANQLIDERDTLAFKVNIIPTGQSQTCNIQFTRQYY